MEPQRLIGSLKVMRTGLLFTFFTLFFGFGLGGIFGAFEHELEEHLRAKAERVLDAKYGGDMKKAEKVLEKSWTYFKRAHLHANGLGSSSLAMILFLALCAPASRLMFITALSLGLGSFGYALYWLIAGFLAPSLGGTGAAKEALIWLAFPSSGLCIVGLMATVCVCISKLWISKEEVIR